jgi:uncharacterized protein (DUF433 family)
MHMFSRIEANPSILGGKPCIKGARISVELILELIASGASFSDIIQAYPHVTTEDIQEAVRYTLQLLKNDIPTESEITA